MEQYHCMTITYKFLDVPDHQQISNDVYKYMVRHTNFLKTSEFWNWTDYKDLLRHVPALDAWLQSKNLNPDMIAIIQSYWNMEQEANLNSLHVDVDQALRILWPIKNCHGTTTKFYDIGSQYLKLTTLEEGTEYYEITSAGPWNVIDEFELCQPVLFNPGVAHCIFLNRKMTQPRWSMTIGFDKISRHRLYSLSGPNQT